MPQLSCSIRCQSAGVPASFSSLFADHVMSYCSATMLWRARRLTASIFRNLRQQSLESTPMLFISFWDLALSNLPIGKFTNSANTGLEAAALISSARAQGEILGVSADDLLAPYGKREYQKHVELCAVLSEQGIDLSVDDFIGPSCSNPLRYAVVGDGQNLIVVSCAYALDVGSGAVDAAAQRLRFEIVRDSISFSLIQLCHEAAL
jgi:hypothetical protein